MGIVGLDGAELPDRCRVRAWSPAVEGIAEVFHAEIVDYHYPAHCHDTWTVLIVDVGAIEYDLDRRHRGAESSTVAVLPPGVVHDGRPATGVHGFRKRNLYLDQQFLPDHLIGPAVEAATIRDAGLRQAISQLHRTLSAPGDELDGEGRLALIGERIRAHLARMPAGRAPGAEPGVAHQLRELLDGRVTAKVTLAEAAGLLDRSVPHLVRSFTREYGVAPHAYVTGRRIDLARRLLLDGRPPAEVAIEVGFYDQAHLNRHFRRHLPVPPAAYARGHLAAEPEPTATTTVR